MPRLLSLGLNIGTVGTLFSDICSPFTPCSLDAETLAERVVSGKVTVADKTLVGVATNSVFDSFPAAHGGEFFYTGWFGLV